MNLALAVETEAGLPVQALLLHLPSGRKISVTVRSFSVGEHGRDPEETVLVFQRWHGIPHLQRTHEAMVDLITAIALIPEQMDRVLPEETFLLSSPVLFIAQQVVDVVRSVLNCLHVNMLTHGRRTGYLYFVAGSGWTTEQEQYWRNIGGFFHGSEVIGDAAFARLDANQERWCLRGISCPPLNVSANNCLFRRIFTLWLLALRSSCSFLCFWSSSGLAY